ncbi:hypothetical protein B0H17DRAFT_1193158 [Mycena rosella]|uniref:Uncharacterized protein n=1 Tax=Mycena rosella TaxID=1033263 RepID=A0AAD7GUJ3_MYCRO|nr:hypothetical protein B0H17DRAFT_1193158 [Mycena rosella]
MQRDPDARARFSGSVRTARPGLLVLVLWSAHPHANAFWTRKWSRRCGTPEIQAARALSHHSILRTIAPDAGLLPACSWTQRRRRASLSCVPFSVAPPARDAPTSAVHPPPASARSPHLSTAGRRRGVGELRTLVVCGGFSTGARDTSGFDTPTSLQTRRLTFPGFESFKTRLELLQVGHLPASRTPRPPPRQVAGP